MRLEPDDTASSFIHGHARRDKNRDNMDRDSTFSSFGSWVRVRRRLLDMTQAELGKRASCSEATIRKIEADQRKPSRQLAELLARALAVPLNETQRFLASARGAWLEDQSFDSAPLAPISNNLPGLLTSTINRVGDHAAVTGLLRERDVRLVTLIGPPGIGKTRLSIHCGIELLSNFPDGVWFVDLSEVSDPAFLIPAIARALTNVDLPPSPGLAQLVAGLRNRRMLLILDNFEQIVDAAMDLAQLLKDCAGIKMLVTSRVPLHIYGEHEYPLPSLTVPLPDTPVTPDALMEYESVQLLVARIRLHDPGFNVNMDNAGAIKQICGILEGIPLALELVAASLRQLALADMVDLLHRHDWIARIGTPARNIPKRQRTLENVIEWSYKLFSEAERDAYDRLSVLSGWFDASAAAALLETGDEQALESLVSLSDHSLLQRGNTARGMCWRMLEIIRAHAYTKLAQPNEIELLRARYFIEEIQKVQRNYSRPEQDRYFTHQLSNLHGALDWLISTRETELAFSLALRLDDYWEPLGFIKEGLKFCEQLFLQADSLQPRQRAVLAQMASDLAWQQHDFETALLFSRQSVEWGQEYGMVNEYPWYLNRLGRIYIEQGKLLEAKTVLREALARSLEAASMLNPGFPLAQLGEVALFEGKLEEAGTLLGQALPYVQDEKSIFFAMVTTDLADVALESEDYDEAYRRLTQSRETSTKHIRRFIVFLCSLAGYLAMSPQSSAEMAARFYGSIETLCDRIGLPLSAYYKIVNQRRMQIARQMLTANAWQKAFDEGKKWHQEDAVRNADILFGG